MEMWNMVSNYVIYANQLQNKSPQPNCPNVQLPLSSKFWSFSTFKFSKLKIIINKMPTCNLK